MIQKMIKFRKGQTLVYNKKYLTLEYNNWILADILSYKAGIIMPEIIPFKQKAFEGMTFKCALIEWRKNLMQIELGYHDVILGIVVQGGGVIYDF